MKILQQLGIIVLLATPLFARVTIESGSVVGLTEASEYGVAIYWNDMFLYNGTTWQEQYMAQGGEEAFDTKWKEWKNSLAPTAFMEGMASVVSPYNKTILVGSTNEYQFNVSVLSLSDNGDVALSLTVKKGGKILAEIEGIDATGTGGSDKERVRSAFQKAGVLFAEKILVKRVFD